MENIEANRATQLIKTLRSCFNEEELLILGYDLKVYPEVLPIEDEAQVAIDLVHHLTSAGRLPELIEICRQVRPHVDWDKFLPAARKRPARFLGQTVYPWPQALHPRQWHRPVWIGIAACIAVLLGVVIWLAGNTQEAPALPPRTAGIPLGKAAVSVDGFCGASGEYSDAFQDTYPDLDAAGQVYFKHDGVYLYACMKGPSGPNPQRFITLNFAPDNDSGQQISEIKAVPANGQVSASPWLSGWSAQVMANQVNDMAEFRVPITAMPGTACAAPFRMAVFHYWMANTGDDYSWINGHRAGYNQPGIWQRVMLQDCP